MEKIKNLQVLIDSQISWDFATNILKFSEHDFLKFFPFFLVKDRTAPRLKVRKNRKNMYTVLVEKIKITKIRSNSELEKT